MEKVNTDAGKVQGCGLHYGIIIHAGIEVELTNPYSGNKFKAFKALCGRRPPKTSVTYGYSGRNEPVNCGKCLAKLTSTACAN
jgi:hypothetical protein